MPFTVTPLLRLVGLVLLALVALTLHRLHGLRVRDAADARDILVAAACFWGGVVGVALAAMGAGLFASVPLPPRPLAHMPPLPRELESLPDRLHH